jgi:hypothetical protein
LKNILTYNVALQKYMIIHEHSFSRTIWLFEKICFYTVWIDTGMYIFNAYYIFEFKFKRGDGCLHSMFWQKANRER